MACVTPRKSFQSCNKMFNANTHRLDNPNCDPKQDIIKRLADEKDISERGFLESCRKIAQPIKQCPVKQRNWQNTFNRCRNFCSCVEVFFAELFFSTSACRSYSDF